MYFKDKKAHNSSKYKEYAYNTYLAQKMSKFFFLSPISLIFLYWAFLITDRSRQYLIYPITMQGLLLILFGYLTLHFGIISLVKQFSNQDFAVFNSSIPVFHKQYVNIMCSVLLLLTYCLLIFMNWIPSLPVFEQKTPALSFGVPIYLFAILSIPFIITWYSFVLLKVETRVLIDLDKQLVEITGRTIHGHFFNYQFSFHNLMSITVQPVRFTADATLESQPIHSKLYGVILVNKDQKFLIFGNTKSCSEEYSQELSNLTGWSVTYTDAGQFIRSSSFNLFIVR